MTASDKVSSFFSTYRQQQFEKGEVLIQLFEQSEHIFFVESGSVRQYAISPTGDEVIVNVYSNPAFVPMVWAVNNADNMYIFEAMSDTVARVASRDDVLNFIKSEPDVMFDLMQRVFSGLDGVMSRMVHLMSGTAYARIIHELVILARRTKSDNDKIQLSVKEYELAMICGLTKETVSRQFVALKAKQLVQVRSDGIIVPSLQRLEAELRNLV